MLMATKKGRSATKRRTGSMFSMAEKPTTAIAGIQSGRASCDFRRTTDCITTLNSTTHKRKAEEKGKRKKKNTENHI